MVKLLLRLVALGLVVTVCFMAYRHFFPSETQRIRRVLAEVAQAASVPDNPTVLGNLVAAQELAGHFCADAEVIVNAPEVGRRSLVGRDEIQQAVLAVRSNVKALKIEFLDVNIELDSQKQSATAELTAKATAKAERDFGIQELKVQFKKTEGNWCITRIETVKTLSL